MKEIQEKITYKKVTKVKLDHQDSKTLENTEWLRWKNNSCRYDSFLSIFSLLLLPDYKEFNRENATRNHMFYEHYLKLCDTAEKLKSQENIEEKLKIVQECWKFMYRVKIDDISPGNQGFVQQLFKLFSPILSLQPFITETKTCKFCELEEKRKTRWPIPIKIHDLNHLKFESIQEYFDWYLNDKSSIHCEVCLQSQLQISSEIVDEPNFIFLEFISSRQTNQLKNFQYTEVLKNTRTKSTFKLIATINRPTQNHFNCCFLKTRLNLIKESESKKELNDWFLHDGIANDGKLTLLKNLSEVWKEKPMILFYKKN